MVTAYQQRPENSTDRFASPGLPDVDLLRAARDIYLVYFQVHSQRMNRPSGVAINPTHYRGQLVFSHKPILLPGEYFVPFEQIESEIF